MNELLKEYIIGFIISLVLTVLAFFTYAHDHAMARPIVIAAAIAQFVVQARYFLHLKFHGEHAWDTWSFVYTGLIVAIVIGGTVWVLVEMMHRMM